MTVLLEKAGPCPRKIGKKPFLEVKKEKTLLNIIRKMTDWKQTGKYICNGFIRRQASNVTIHHSYEPGKTQLRGNHTGHARPAAWRVPGLCRRHRGA